MTREEFIKKMKKLDYEEVEDDIKFFVKFGESIRKTDGEKKAEELYEMTYKVRKSQLEATRY